MQIAAFMNLAEDARKQRMKERRRASVSHKRRVRPEWQKPVSPILVDEELTADGSQVTTEPQLISDQKSELMSRLKKLIHAEEGGNGKNSVKFSDKYEATINLLEAVQPNEYKCRSF